MQSQRDGDNLASLSVEDSRKFLDAFIDYSQVQKDKDQGKALDIKFARK